ncbi:LysR family transcriptional regulator [Pseudobacteriovorax antillogorgiicola]|uniref:Transcriptional regulator, LysR family n=1 Tax=Pseudobacteriovorax antillogorgiicola TaxID=1513793 RepID=A0A1Y6B619_9BACT|nr:LysR family transcriptional regulator [Pseudobacteriovorax antillogorgiicola]TCS58850.1 LysR family transcriptional regulator [Pseudobacteriovorax antillogorgiicola]SME94031.1 transcriptional regulator, LysR family [Pseudobacteriovorax antillogorgiicola]
MNAITLDQIKCFSVLSEEGSFTQSARRLYRAKSAVRYAIGQLEEQLGFALLDRSAYRPQLTAQGRQFLKACGPLLEQHQRFLNACQQISTQIETRLAISVSGIYGLTHVYPHIRDLMSRFPQTEIILEREILSGERMLKEGQVELAIFEHLQDDKSLESKKIDEVRLQLVIARQHPFLALPKADQTVDQLLGYPQIVQRSTLPQDDVSKGVHRGALIWRVTDTPSKLEIISNGLGWGRLPEHDIKPLLDAGELIHLSHLQQDDSVDIFLCRRREGSVGKVADHFWNAFSERSIR